MTRTLLPTERRTARYGRPPSNAALTHTRVRTSALTAPKNNKKYKTFLKEMDLKQQEMKQMLRRASISLLSQRRLQASDLGFGEAIET
mmetsp:Transcript_9491/g.17147  ORF Transcript_9491/g.17147 Transcript_9491/m.17147 type:complete len:88 (-) Transcript_9491:20-283(-)